MDHQWPFISTKYRDDMFRYHIIHTNGMNNTALNIQSFQVVIQLAYSYSYLFSLVHTCCLKLICRSIIRTKWICIAYSGFQQRVYILYMNKGFIFFHPWSYRIHMAIYLFRTSINNLDPWLISSQSLNKASFRIESQTIKSNSLCTQGVYMKAALTSSPVEASLNVCLSSSYSHQVLFTLSYPLVSMNPIFGCSSSIETKVALPSTRFRNELPFVVC
jgi:hypothetical protein